MIDKYTTQIHHGDAFDVLDDLPAESVHAVVTDPPYGLAFMGRDWDDFEPKEYQEWCEVWAGKAKRVLKPGGHLLAFSGNRTHHRLFTGVEDAGFEIRDTLTWHYGSGFPKATDVSKTIDKRKRKEVIQHLTVEHLEDAGIPEPKTTYRDWMEEEHTPSDKHWKKIRKWVDDADELDRESLGLKPWTNSANHTVVGEDHTERVQLENTEPATTAAKRWDGWKTGLKPATEFVVMARKPFDGATVDCVLEHGTGALNVDGCRIEMENGETKAKFDRVNIDQQDQQKYGTYEKDGTRYAGESTEGRYPANVVFGERAAADLDAEVGDTPTGDDVTRSNSIWGNASDGDGMDGEGYEDGGGPSRYFYTSKATRAERTMDGTLDNDHPTVKPQDLMEWLVRLVTRKDQIVLDPFAGSGTTCMAAKELGRRFIGIEKQQKYVDLARARVGLDTLDDDEHISLGEFAND